MWDADAVHQVPIAYNQVAGRVCAWLIEKLVSLGRQSDEKDKTSWLDNGGDRKTFGKFLKTIKYNYI